MTIKDVVFKDIGGIKYFAKESEESSIYEYLGTRLAQIVSPDLVPGEIMCFLPGQLGTFNDLDKNVSFKGLAEPHTLYIQRVDGKTLDTENCEHLFYQIGRQQALHKFLRLSDVKPEHFLVEDGIVKRIDLDSAFSETAVLASFKKFVPIENTKEVAEATETAQAMATDKFSLKNELNEKYKSGINENYVKGVKDEAKNISKNFVKNKNQIDSLLEKSLEIGDVELTNSLLNIRASNIGQLMYDITEYWKIIGILK